MIRGGCCSCGLTASRRGDYERLNTVAPEQAARADSGSGRQGLVVGLPPDDNAAPAFAISAETEEIRLFLNDRIPKLLNHLRREPSLKNADYRALFHVDRHRALRELRQLVTLGVLVDTGVGRGTRYKADGARRGTTTMSIPPQLCARCKHQSANELWEYAHDELQMDMRNRFATWTEVIGRHEPLASRSVERRYDRRQHSLCAFIV